MTSRDFCYWLQGFFEVGSPVAITPYQTAMIKAHLAMVFRHEIDPSFGNPDYVEELRKVHEDRPTEETFCTPAPTPETTKEQFPDGAPVQLGPELTGILPADWLSKLPKGGVGGAFNC
jgi:hypothetical protein